MGMNFSPQLGLTRKTWINDWYHSLYKKVEYIPADLLSEHVHCTRQSPAHGTGPWVFGHQVIYLGPLSDMFVGRWVYEGKMADLSAIMCKTKALGWIRKCMEDDFQIGYGHRYGFHIFGGLKSVKSHQIQSIPIKLVVYNYYRLLI